VNENDIVYDNFSNENGSENVIVVYDDHVNEIEIENAIVVYDDLLKCVYDDEIEIEIYLVVYHFFYSFYTRV
jgi:hypothetical protein